MFSESFFWTNVFSYAASLLDLLKFIYFEKATKFYEISTLLLSVCTVDKDKVESSQNFVAFSEYTNFIYVNILVLRTHHKYILRVWGKYLNLPLFYFNKIDALFLEFNQYAATDLIIRFVYFVHTYVWQIVAEKVCIQTVQIWCQPDVT